MRMYSDLQHWRKDELDALRDTARKMKKSLEECKRLLDQVNTNEVEVEDGIFKSRVSFAVCNAEEALR